MFAAIMAFLTAESMLSALPELSVLSALAAPIPQCGLTAALAPLGALFIHPIELPAGWRLPLLVPLAVCIAAVYRATRSRSARELPFATAITTLNIVFGMFLIAVGFYVLHEVVKRFF